MWKKASHAFSNTTHSLKKMNIIVEIIIIAILLVYIIYLLHQEKNKAALLSRITAERDEALVRCTAARTELETWQKHARELNEKQQEQFNAQIALLREQMQNITQEVLNRKTDELGERNSQQMAAIINPLKETIGQMRVAMDNSRDASSKNSASLEKAIEEVLKRTLEVGREADKLAGALRGKNKIQGNWGELILTELLQSQGLIEGVHFDTQATLCDEQGKAVLNEDSGKRMIPDTILHYPDGKDAVIDSKVSLTAYLDYQNADGEVAKAEALDRHVKSVRQHVLELARKDYSNYIRAPRQALNYVIMFVPNEGALRLAFETDTTLWRDAFAKGVFVTGEQNLTAALRIIQIAWTQMQQAQNQEAVFEGARMLLDRVADFTAFFDDMGKKLQDAQACYTKSADKLRDGRLSVVGAAQKLVSLGAKTSAKKQLPNINGLL